MRNAWVSGLSILVVHGTKLEKTGEKHVCLFVFKVEVNLGTRICFWTAEYEMCLDQMEIRGKMTENTLFGS